MKRYSREEILSRLKGQIAKREAIIISEAGVGLAAKMADMAGIDIITIATPGIYRMHGVNDVAAFRPYDDCNQLIMDLARRMHTVVQNAPVIAGIFIADPYKKMEDVLDTLFHYGVSGVSNVPSMGMLAGARRENVETAGIGFDNECAFLQACREKDIFTIGHAFSLEDLDKMAATGADIVCLDFRFWLEMETAPELYEDLPKVCAMVQDACERVHAINPQSIVAIHGGPFHAFEAAKTCFETTDLQAYLGSASLDSIPISIHVKDTLERFRSCPLR